MAMPTEQEMTRLYEGFEPHDLLDAVDLLDELRGSFLGSSQDDAPEL